MAGPATGNGTNGSVPLTLPARPRLLVVNLRRIGDLLLTTPLIRSLRRAWPDAQIDVLAFKGPDRILAGNPDIDTIITMPARPGPIETAKLLARLWKRYDLAISTQSGDRPTFFTVVAGRTHAGLTDPDGPAVSGVAKRFLLDRSTLTEASLHRVEQMLRLADLVGVARVPEMVCPAEKPPSFDPGENFALIHAAPMFRYKEWTCEGWRALAAGLKDRGVEPVAISAPDESEQRYLADVWQGVAPVHQARWAETVWLLKRARVYIGPDTSVTHLAAATGCPTVALFGPMDPRVWGPFPVGGLSAPWAASGTIQACGNVFLVQNPLPCLPCTFEGCERRIDSYSTCLDELQPAQVLAAVDRALATPDACQMTKI
ncbi:MAG: glycosyltransferase family 9 protein [Pseudolabrys sp.]